jgi:hypothetical protein
MDIVAVGHPVGNAKCLPVSSENESVLELKVPATDISTLHEDAFGGSSQKYFG